jgi:opacity protein-like surface antigen
MKKIVLAVVAIAFASSAAYAADAAKKCCCDKDKMPMEQPAPKTKA